MLIFHPGFSTAEKLSDVSGRGVGMDVVRRSIEALNGSVSIDSEFGVRTTFTIKLPLTLAVIDGMIIQSGTERYIIPTLSIITTLQPHQDNIATCSNRGEMLQWQDDIIPIFKLGDLFDIPQATSKPTKGSVLFSNTAAKRLVF